MHHLTTNKNLIKAYLPMFYFISFFFTSKLVILSPFKHRNPTVVRSNSAAESWRERAPPELPDPRAKSKFPDGISGVFGKTTSGAWLSDERKPTKLLMNVNLQGSLGPVQVVMSPENCVGELIKAVVEIYMREKRRPLLATSDTRSFELHYSQFSLEGLKPREKLNDLGSRNFFLCQKPSNAARSSSKAEPPFALTKLMDFLL